MSTTPSHSKRSVVLKGTAIDALRKDGLEKLLSVVKKWIMSGATELEISVVFPLESSPRKLTDADNQRDHETTQSL